MRGQITCAVDPAGIETRYQYDRFGRLTALVNPNNERWQFDYDAGHRLLAQSDFAGRRRQYRYNPLGQVSAITEYPLAQVDIFDYEDNDIVSDPEEKVTYWKNWLSSL
ncbi:Uncharacterized conserved protein [Serratia rubidaea]|nr:Uncharacterized conserved protein [Serratia rubidaea]